jgi:hypothetical protein
MFEDILDEKQPEIKSFVIHEDEQELYKLLVEVRDYIIEVTNANLYMGNTINKLHYENHKLEQIIEKQRMEIEYLNENAENMKAWIEMQNEDIRKVKDGVSNIGFSEARDFMFKTFVNDPDFLRLYVDNISIFLLDEQNWSADGLDFKDKSTRDRIAAYILGLVFSDEVKPIKSISPGVGVVEVDT